MFVRAGVETRPLRRASARGGVHEHSQNKVELRLLIPHASSRQRYLPEHSLTPCSSDLTLDRCMIYLITVRNATSYKLLYMPESTIVVTLIRGGRTPESAWDQSCFTLGR